MPHILVYAYAGSYAVLNPMIDCVFKAILGSEKNKNLIIHFLNAVLELCGPNRITDIVLLNPYNERNFITDKLSVVDVKARQVNDEHIQIEVQLNAHPALSERMLFTWAAIYRSQIQKGQNYSDLNPVISIWLVGDTLFKHTTPTIFLSAFLTLFINCH